MKNSYLIYTLRILYPVWSFDFGKSYTYWDFSIVFHYLAKLKIIKKLYLSLKINMKILF